jgi:pyruvate dehydrogenase (quinone)
MKEWNKLMAERGMRRDKPMEPEVVAYELNKLIADDAIVATERNCSR